LYWKVLEHDPRVDTYLVMHAVIFVSWIQNRQRGDRSYLVYPPFPRVVLSATFLLSYNIYNLYIHGCKEINSIFGRTTEYTEWQWPLYGIDSIMMLKSAQPGGGRGRGARPSPLTLVPVTSVVYAQAERADTLPIFLLYTYMYSVGRLTGVYILSTNL
jgi:hypothetical protein